MENMATGVFGLLAQNLAEEDHKEEHGIAIIPHRQEKERTARDQVLKEEVVQMISAKVCNT